MRKSNGNRSHDEVGRIVRFLKRERHRVCEVVSSLSISGAGREAQEVFDELIGVLTQQDLQERRDTLEILSRNVGETLRDRRVTEDIALVVEGLIVRNWAKIVEEGSRVSLLATLQRAVEQWEMKEGGLAADARSGRLSASQDTVREIAMGAARLVAGGGVLVFDAAKFLLVEPAPTFMFSSFMAGAVLFFNGVDSLWKGIGSREGEGK